MSTVKAIVFCLYPRCQLSSDAQYNDVNLCNVEGHAHFKCTTVQVVIYFKYLGGK